MAGAFIRLRSKTPVQKDVLPMPSWPLALISNSPWSILRVNGMPKQSGYRTTPGQPAWHGRTGLPAPSTGRRDAAWSIPVVAPSATAARLLHGAVATDATRYSCPDYCPTAGDVNQIVALSPNHTLTDYSNRSECLPVRSKMISSPCSL